MCLCNACTAMYWQKPDHLTASCFKENSLVKEHPMLLYTSLKVLSCNKLKLKYFRQFKRFIKFFTKVFFNVAEIIITYISKIYYFYNSDLVCYSCFLFVYIFYFINAFSKNVVYFNCKIILFVMKICQYSIKFL